MVLALALLSVPVMASMDGSLFGNNNGDGVFETDISAIKFPAFQDTNVDSLDVGNDKAVAFGSIWQTGFRSPKATNNLEITKNQDTGECAPCQDFNGTCTDSCLTVNLEQIKVGNRDALAFGFATATNNVKIVTNQQ
ncbi:MAG: hypothetical protein HGA93_00030 [Methanothrix sp.]|jgi:hypothetical protein|nr:hypothetical protein [Methanothrix sp.]